MICRGCYDANCPDCVDLRETRRKVIGETRNVQEGASLYHFGDRVAAARTVREVRQWKALKLIADLANATLRSGSMKPHELDDTFRTLQRTARIALLRPRKKP